MNAKFILMMTISFVCFALIIKERRSRAQFHALSNRNTADFNEAPIVDKNADVDRIEQETQWYCGPACAAMVLSRFEVDVSQNEAYKKIHDEKRFEVEKLYSDPLGLKKYISSSLANSSSFIPEVVVATDFSTLVNKIYHSISLAGMPCPTLVFEGAHWIIIDTVRSIKRTGALDEIIGVFIENPSAGKPPSSYVSIEELKTRYIKPNKWGKTWHGALVSIAANDDGKENDTAVVILDTSTPFNPVATHLAGRPFSENDALKLALANLTAHGFSDTAEIFGGGAPVTVPLRILDEGKNEAFWIIPIDATANKNFQNFVYSAIDEGTGRLLEISHMQNYLNIFNDTEVEEIVERAKPGTHLRVEAGYFWTDSYYNMSRFNVYRKVSIDGVTFYVTWNGEIVSKLLENPEFGG